MRFAHPAAPDEDARIRNLTAAHCQPAQAVVAALGSDLARGLSPAQLSPSALAAALSIAGLKADTFVFLGFLPHKKGRQTLLKEIAADERAYVLYESSHRIIKLLEEFETFLPERTIAVARERLSPVQHPGKIDPLIDLPDKVAYLRVVEILRGNFFGSLRMLGVITVDRLNDRRDILELFKRI